MDVCVVEKFDAMRSIAMKLNAFAQKTAALMTVLALSTALTSVPAMAQAADKAGHTDMVETRIKTLHTKLHITAAQEAQWTIVAGVMRDDAKNMDMLIQSRDDQSKTMTAVDDLKSYAEISTAHADGVKKLVPVFATLYTALSPAQQKEADTLFRHSPTKTASK